MCLTIRTPYKTTILTEDLKVKHTFKFTEHEMRLIRLALDREVKRKEEINSTQTEEVKELADYFERRIRDAQNTIKISF